MTQLVRIHKRTIAHCDTSISSVPLPSYKERSPFQHRTLKTRSSATDPTFYAPLQVLSLASFPRHNKDILFSPEPQPSPNFLSTLNPSKSPQRTPSNGKNHHQNCGFAARHTLFLPRVLPPKDSYGLLKPPRPSGSDVALPPTFVRDGYMGRRRQYRGPKLRACRAVSTRARPDDVFASHMYKHEAGAG